jgi:hypothetical protein
MTTARQIITLTLEETTVIGAGETISAEDMDYYFRQLNTIADKLSAGRVDLFKDQLISGTVTGTTLTLGIGSFASIAQGSEIQGMLADNYTMSPITFEQYRDIFNKNVTGRPINYAYNGFDTIYLYPAANSNVMTVQARSDIQQFATYDTNYTFPAGYKSAFIACLSTVAARTMNMLSSEIKKNETNALKAIEGANIRPLILNSTPFDKKNIRPNILNGFN